MNTRNEQFLQRLLRRRPQDKAEYESMLEAPPPQPLSGNVEVFGLGTPALELPNFEFSRDAVLETIVRRERPVLLVERDRIKQHDVSSLGKEAIELVEKLTLASDRIHSLLPLIGRIDVKNFPSTDYVGTGWFVDTDIVVTNRHVASLIAKWDGREFVFALGIGGRPIVSSVCTTRENGEAAPDSARVFGIEKVLYIERDSGPNDIAFLKVSRRTNGTRPASIKVASTNIAAERRVCVIGYPARAPSSVIPDQALMQELYLGVYDVKRIAPGFSMPDEGSLGTHDCTTLGGNSGSVVIDLETGEAVGLHFSGLYKEANFTVRASELSRYVSGKVWNEPYSPAPSPNESSLPSSAVPQNAVSGAAVAPSATVTASLTLSIPIQVKVELGTPSVSGSPVVGAAIAVHQSDTPHDVASVEAAAADFYDARPTGVLATRVGFSDEGGEIGGTPFIAASVAPDRVATFAATAPREFRGVAVRYLPAEVGEQLEARPMLEAVAAIAYDDDAREGEEFSFSSVNEDMEVVLHVGPEHSWNELERFLGGVRRKLVSAIYEFHAPHIKDAIEARLQDGVSLKLVADNVTFSKVRDPEEEFDRVEVFEEWAENHKFERIVPPEGTTGLIANAYHIKVSVRDDGTFWLSSGNWKAGSSQPIITAEEIDNAANVDLRGNREWHVVIKNDTLAQRFRSHILQDFKRSEELGGAALPRRLMEETFVLVPQEEAVVLERKPPSRVLSPKRIHRKVKVRPLLTPDRQGAVYCDAVLDLIESARESLLFQIPYIAMPPSPRARRGFIDDLIRALTRKLKTLDDARVILRSGGSKFSSPRHAAWFFKSKGVDIDSRLRVIEDHHTKGMIVDGKRVLLGSHNWSGPGVTLNRDASLIFDDREVAEYYASAFEIDWERARRIKPGKFVAEAAVLESPGSAVPEGFRRVPISEWLTDD